MPPQPPIPPSDRSPSKSDGSAPDEREIEQTLRDVERSLLLLKARYAQVQADQQRRQELRVQFNQTQHQFNQTRSNSLQAELKQIKQQLEDLEVALESQLFSWSGLKDVFWQAVRFGGLGIVVGWLLKTWAGG